MVRIGLCNDQLNLLEHIKYRIEMLCKLCRERYEISAYLTPGMLIDDVKDEKKYFDILLLNIKMPELYGFYVSKAIEKELPNVIVIYIASHMECAGKAIEAACFRFILEESIKNHLENALLDAIKLVKSRDKSFYVINTTRKYLKLYYKDIIYIYKSQKNSIFVTHNGEEAVRKTLMDVYREIETQKKEFFMIERGLIVNLEYVFGINDKNAILKDGRRLPIGSTYLDKVKKRLVDYWGD